MKFFKLILILLISSQFAFGQSSISLTKDSFFNKKGINKSDDKFTFAIIGDKTGGGEFNWPIFDRAVDEINLLRPDFVIMVGDMIQGAVSDENIIKNMWDEFNSHAQRLEIPLLIYPGNHDMSNEVMYDYWTNNISLRYYSFVHKKTLFLLLNTEEFRKTKDGALGKKQLNFIKKELAKNSNLSQLFIFMHRPLWTKDGGRHGGADEWGQILSWIKNKNATIIAGHWHSLLYQEIEDHRHIIHSATGGVLDEKALPELGQFHHYSMVSVDKDSSIVSIIKPGNIYPENIANKEFVDNVESLVKTKSYVKYENETGELQAGITFSLENRLNKPIELEIKINNFENGNWDFNKQIISEVLQAGASEQYVFTGINKLETCIPFPRAEYVIKIGEDTIDDGRKYFVPGEEAGWRFPDSALILGAFPLGITKKPKTKEDVINNIPLFNHSWTQDSIFIVEQMKGHQQWKHLKVSEAKINGDIYFYNRDFSAAYVNFNIYSPEEKLVLAAVRPDNYCKVYLNGQTVLDGFPRKGVPGSPYLFLLPLKKGNNNVLLKMADYYGNWYTQFKVIDPENSLRFNTVKPEINF